MQAAFLTEPSGEALACHSLDASPRRGPTEGYARSAEEVAGNDIWISGRHVMRCLLETALFQTAVAACLVGAGCGDEVDAPPVDLTLVYEFDGLDCAAAGVGEVVILGRSASSEERFSELLRCDLHPDAVEIRDLRPGRYLIDLAGQSPEGITLYATAEAISIRVDQDETVTINAPFTAGDLNVAWDLEGIEGCGAVRLIQVRLIDPFDTVVDQSTYDCEVGMATYRNLQSGEWMVQLDGIDGTGRTLFRSEPTGIFVEPQLEARAFVGLGVID